MLSLLFIHRVVPSLVTTLTSSRQRWHKFETFRCLTNVFQNPSLTIKLYRRNLQLCGTDSSAAAATCEWHNLLHFGSNLTPFSPWEDFSWWQNWGRCAVYNYPSESKRYKLFAVSIRRVKDPESLNRLVLPIFRVSLWQPDQPFCKPAETTFQQKFANIKKLFPL